MKKIEVVKKAAAEVEEEYQVILDPTQLPRGGGVYLILDTPEGAY